MPRLAVALVLGVLALPTLAAAQPAARAGQAPDPPLLPDGPEPPPTATSGTDVVPAEPPQAPAVVPVDRQAEARQDERLEQLERRTLDDEQRIRRIEHQLKLLRNLRIEAYVQPQLVVQT